MEQHEKMVGLSLWARSCCDNDEVLVVQFFNDGLPGRDALRDNARCFVIDLPPLERHRDRSRTRDRLRDRRRQGSETRHAQGWPAGSVRGGGAGSVRVTRLLVAWDA